MTERERDQDFLAQLIERPLAESGALGAAGPLLTAAEEQSLLQEANRAAPPSLAPLDLGAARPNFIAGASASFASEALDIVRRHPVPAMLVAAGAAFLLTRRRR